MADMTKLPEPILLELRQNKALSDDMFEGRVWEKGGKNEENISFGSRRLAWKDVAERLSADGHTVLTPDLPGYDADRVLYQK